MCASFLAGCEPWTSISHPGMLLEAKEEPSRPPAFFRHHLWIDTPHGTPRSMGLRTMRVCVHTVSTARGRVKSHKEPPQHLSFCRSELSLLHNLLSITLRSHTHIQTPLWKLSVLPRMLTEMSCWIYPVLWWGIKSSPDPHCCLIIQLRPAREPCWSLIIQPPQSSSVCEGPVKGRMLTGRFSSLF